MATPNSLLITQLYVGYFNRAPDPEGLNYWVGRLEAGMTLPQIANSFAVQPEATSTYPWLAAPNLDVGIPEFITSVYQNLFERNPDPAGLAFWTQELLNGKPPGQFILDVISGAQGDDKLVIDHKKEVGNYYADQALLRGLDWNVADDLAGAAAVMDGDRAFWVSANSLVAGKANADAIITEQLEGPPGTIELTTGVDNVTVGANETVLGNDLTWNPGDKITGASGTVDINYGVAPGPFFGTITNVDLVNLTTNGPTVQVATLWTDVDKINVKQSTGALKLDDLQATSNDAASGTGFTKYAVSDYVTDKTVTFNFDIQAANGGNTVVDLDVSEVTGGILMNSGVGGDLETVQMHILDVAGATSKIASFSAQGIQTLKIDGGTAGLDFQIVAPLDAGLVTIDAANAKANLTLDVSNSTKGMNIALGSGNDLLITGDTLLPVGGLNDTINGGAGTDTVSAVFTTAGTRTPTMNAVEIANLTFNNNATFDFSKTNDLHTINVASSSHRISLIEMDSTVQNINVTGLQAPTKDIAFGTATHDFFWVDGTTVNMNWTSKVAEDMFNSANLGAGQLHFMDIQTVNFTHSGPFDTSFSDVPNDGDNAVWLFDDDFSANLLNLKIVNAGTGDLYFRDSQGDEAIAGTRNMRNLEIHATGGDIDSDGDVDTILNLRTLTLTANGGNVLNWVDFGSVTDFVTGGSGLGAFLTDVNITAGSNSDIFFDDLRADKSTISTFNVTVGNDGSVITGDIVAQDISDATIIINEEGFFDSDVWSFQINQGDKLVVSGSGVTGDWDFTDEAFAFMDFSGLVDTGPGKNGVDIDFDGAEFGSTLITTKFNDIINASQGNDDITSGLGDDFVDANKGNDVITDAGGNNTIRGDLGVDTINLLAVGSKNVDDIIVGWRGPNNADKVNGFDTDFDQINLDLSDIENTAANGNPTNMDDVIQGNGAAVSAADAVVIQSIIGKDVLHFDANVFTVSGTFSGLSALETAIQLGGSHEFRNTILQGPAGVADAFMVQWTDNGGNAHVSAAIIDSQHFDAGTLLWAYNFTVQDMVTVAGVPVLNQPNFDFIA